MISITHSTLNTSNISKNELPIYSVETDKKVVSITFDSAWGTEDLDTILEILKKHNCSATFFVTGDWASDNPDAILKLRENGHIIGSHGMHHKHMTTLSKEEMATVCDHKDLKNGSIILLHNGSKYTAMALDDLLTNLESKGYTYISLPELIIKENYSMDHTGRQIHNN